MTVDTFVSGAMRSNRSIIRRGLDQRVDVNGTGMNGSTALTAAIERKAESLVHLLLTNKEAPADPNQDDQRGHSPLRFAVQENAGKGILRLLLQAKADANRCDSQGFTVLHTLIFNCSSYSKQSLTCTVHTLLYQGDARTSLFTKKDGYTLEQWASMRHSAILVQTFRDGARMARADMIAMVRNHLISVLASLVVNEYVLP